MKQFVSTMDPALGNDLLQEIVRVGREKFRTGCHVYWLNKKKAVQDELETRFGFTIAENGSSLVCGRGVNPKHNTPA